MKIRKLKIYKRSIPLGLNRRGSGAFAIGLPNRLGYHIPFTSYSNTEKARAAINSRYAYGNTPKGKRSSRRRAQEYIANIKQSNMLEHISRADRNRREKEYDAGLARQEKNERLKKSIAKSRQARFAPFLGKQKDEEEPRGRKRSSRRNYDGETSYSGTPHAPSGRYYNPAAGEYQEKPHGHYNPASGDWE